MDRFRNRQRGFTLVELVVVIAILGLLAGIIVPTVSNVTSTARGSQKEGDRGAVSTAATNYESDQNSKPVSGTAATKTVRDTNADNVIKVVVNSSDSGSVDLSATLSDEDVVCGDGTGTVAASLAECFAAVDFTALLNNGDLAELPAHTSEFVATASASGNDTTADVTITGANKAGNSLEIHLDDTLPASTLAVWNLDASSNVLLLKNDNDYGK